MEKLKVQLRGGFSDRNGIKKENISMQLNSLDERTRVALINIINAEVDRFCNRFDLRDYELKWIALDIMRNVYVKEVSIYEHEYSFNEVLKYIRQTVRDDTYDDILTIIQYLLNLISQKYVITEFYNSLNEIFEKEYVGYRFVNKKITKITDDIEIQEIENVNEVEIDSAKEHINKSLAYLSNRTNPDYENSIKESISAVEAMCNSIVGKADSLGKTLDKLEQSGVVIHGALKDAFNSLFGWTSDGTGIRHAGKLDGSKATFDEAKFMLVSCCAFINYLKSSMKD